MNHPTRARPPLDRHAWQETNAIEAPQPDGVLSNITLAFDGADRPP